MKPILDQNGNVIKNEQMTAIYNRGPLWALGSLYSAMMGTFLNPDRIGINTYKEMERDDAVSSGLQFVTLATMTRLGEYTHPDIVIQKYIRKEFQSMQGSIEEAMEECFFTGLQCGFSVGELCFTLDSQVHLTDIQYLDPEYAMFELYTDGPMKNRVKSVKQYGTLLGLVDNQYPLMDKFIHFVNRPRFMNPYGRSGLESIYPPYYIKTVIVPAWMITIEKIGTPARNAEVSMEAPKTVDLGNGEKVNLYDFLEHTFLTWSNKTGVATPPGVTLKYEPNRGNVGQVFESAINYADKCIYRGLLIPGLVASTATNGNRALGDVHYDMFDLGIDKNAKALKNVFLNQLIRRLIAWNFGPQDTWGDFQERKPDPQVTKLEMNIIKEATDSGYLSPDRLQDYKHARERIGAPEVSDEEFNQDRAEKKAQAEELQKRLDEKRTQLEQQQQQKDKNQPPLSLEEKPAFSRLNGLDSFFVEV